MLITDHFVFITMPKTGWTFSKNYLDSMYKSKTKSKYFCHIPEKHLGKFKFGNVRNPWDYYVSWYSYQKQYEGTILEVILNGKENTFDNFIKCVMNYDGAKNKKYSKIISNRSKELNAKYLTDGIKIKEENIGLLTWYYISYYFNDCYDLLVNQKYSFDYIKKNHDKLFGLDFVCKMENLNRDLILALNKANAPLNKKQKSNILNAQKINKSKHNHYTTYYTEETKKLVAKKDKLIIDKYNYRFR